MAKASKDATKPVVGSPDAIKKFARRIERAYGPYKEAQMEHASIYKESDELGINRQAMAFAMKLKRMSPDKRGDILRSFDDIRRALDLDVKDMLDGASPVANNVTTLAAREATAAP